MNHPDDLPGIDAKPRKSSRVPRLNRRELQAIADALEAAGALESWEQDDPKSSALSKIQCRLNRISDVEHQVCVAEPDDPVALFCGHGRPCPVHDRGRAEHALVLEGHPWTDWRLDCRHGEGPYKTFNPLTGETEEDPECPLVSWWEELGMELLDETKRWPTPRSNEIEVEALWWNDESPTLVPFED